jgi:hypothetical protein
MEDIWIQVLFFLALTSIDNDLLVRAQRIPELRINFIALNI